MERDKLIQIVILIIAVIALILAVFAVMVTDDDEETEEPDNVSPTASIAVSSTSIVEEMTNIFFDASGSSDPDGTIVEYSWDFGDGSKDSGMYTNHAFFTANTYIVTLTVIDNDGATGIDTVSINITEIIVPANTPPIASYLLSGTSADIHEHINCDGSSSTDSDGEIVMYTWDFGDGTNSTGIFTNHYYTSPGTYSIKLTVTDDDGAQNSTTKEVTVTEQSVPENVPPIASFSVSDTTVEEYTYINLNGSASSDSDGTIVEFTWDFGDGVMDSGMYSSHYYTSDGVYLVALTVVDDQGAQNTSSVEITVIEGGGPFPNQPPTADIQVNRTTIEEETSLTFNGSGSSDSDGAIVEYSWDIDGGFIQTGMVFNYYFDIVGSYNVTLTVYDNDGASDTDSIIITVHAKITGALDFTGISYGNYTGGIVSLSDTLDITDTKLVIIDDSLGMSANQDPLASGVTLQVSGGLNFTYTDINANSEVDAADVMIIKNAMPGDVIRLIYKPTGGIIAEYVIPPTPTGALSFTESSVNPGNYTGCFIALSAEVKLSEAIMNITDESLGLSAEQEPIDSGVVLQVPGGVQITYTDINANSKIDAGDIITVWGGATGDVIRFLYIPTGEVIAQITLA